MRSIVAIAALAAVAAIAAASCSRAPAIVPSNAVQERPATHAAALAQKLVIDAYGVLFHYPEHDETLVKIWNEAGNAVALEALIDDASAPPKARFIAAEVLFARDFTFLGRHDRGTVARIYAFALQHKLTGHLNAWGMVWYNDYTGPVGNRFVGIGKAAIPVLRELLEDRTVMRGYFGSEEATIGNGAKFRVRDFAAYYLSQIIDKELALKVEPPMTADYVTRDAAIEKLIAELPGH